MIHFNIMKVKAKDLVHKHIVDDLDNESLSQGKQYYVIGIEGDFYRVVDDQNEPILYSKQLFEIVDNDLPSDWIEEKYEDEVFVGPPETLDPGFYEDYFDGVPSALEIYSHLLEKLGIQS